MGGPQKTVFSLKECSRRNWTTSDEQLTYEQLNTAALLRIADALEVQTEPVKSLRDVVENLRQSALDYQLTALRLQRENATLKKSIRALRGVVTKLRNQAARAGET